MSDLLEEARAVADSAAVFDDDLVHSEPHVLISIVVWADSEGAWQAAITRRRTMHDGLRAWLSDIARSRIVDFLSNLDGGAEGWSFHPTANGWSTRIVRTVE